ncbi:MAG: ribose-5-phosphate isomerase RpiA [Euryarchaeota archaeon]|nr:ribose-5-phosphate isomerase RpiA [Euryarchaeota archaeon]
MKKLVAERAVDDYVKDGMTVGLGTGTTAYHAIRRIGELVSRGYDLRCVSTSAQTDRIAEDCGIEVVPLCDVPHIDVTIDGADEVDPELQLIKGLGGALLKEKIVAAATVLEVIVVDETKLVDKLGSRCPLPVEVVPFGHSRTAYALGKQGCEPVLRMDGDGVFVTDSGNYIYDCRFDGIASPFFLETRLNVIPGVVENGLFLNTASAVLVSRADGSVTLMER